MAIPHDIWLIIKDLYSDISSKVKWLGIAVVDLLSTRESNSDTSYPVWIIEALYALDENTGNSPLSIYTYFSEFITCNIFKLLKILW